MTWIERLTSTRFDSYSERSLFASWHLMRADPMSPSVVKKTAASENRKYLRLGSRMRCWCEGDNVTVFARIGNVSEGGLFLRTSTPLECGSRTQVRFGSPQNQVFARAVVVWAREDGAEGPAGMGLEFMQVDDATAHSIRSIVSESSRQHNELLIDPEQR